MITLITKTGTVQFNLKNQRREHDLCMTMTHLKDQESTSSLKITTSYDENLLIKIPDIIDFKFTDMEYIKPETKTETPKENLVDKIMKTMDESKRRRVQKFLDVLKAKGAPINPDDPLFQKIIDKL